MSRNVTRRHAAALSAFVVIGASALAGCGGGSSSNAATGSADPGPCGTTDDTTLTVGLFGTFGFKEAGLWDAYKKVCPNITIKADVVEQSAEAADSTTSRRSRSGSWRTSCRTMPTSS